MSLYYPVQNNVVAIGTKVGTTRTPVALTTAYGVANKTHIFETGKMTKINLDVLYTTGTGETGSSVQIRVDQGFDGVNFYRLPNEAVSAGTSTLTDREFTRAGGIAATAYNYSIGLDIFYKFTRISVKESGVVTNAGTIYVEGTVSGK